MGGTKDSAAFKVKAAPGYLRWLQIGLLVLSILCTVLVLVEIQFQKRYAPDRWFNDIHWSFMILMKLSNVLRLTAYVGTFVTAIFYLTNKVVYMFALGFIINVIVMIYLIFVVEPEVMEDFESKSLEVEKEAWLETNGTSPVWFLWANLLLPILFIPAFYPVYQQTGLILKDNDSIRENETDFVNGQNSNPGQEQIELATKAHQEQKDKNEKGLVEEAINE